MASMMVVSIMTIITHPTVAGTVDIILYGLVRSSGRLRSLSGWALAQLFRLTENTFRIG